MTYDELVNYGYKKHYRVKHDHNVFADEPTILTELRTFGAYAKSDWLSFGMYTNSRSFIHLKECEFRYICAEKTHIYLCSITLEFILYYLEPKRLIIEIKVARNSSRKYKKLRSINT